jgi:hypothetical protein
LDVIAGSGPLHPSFKVWPAGGGIRARVTLLARKLQEMRVELTKQKTKKGVGREQKFPWQAKKCVESLTLVDFCGTVEYIAPVTDLI